MRFKTLESQIIERAAPSPTGGLHIGHVYSVITAYENARSKGGLFKLRIEDIDVTRCKLKYENEIISNLSWLGVTWDGRVMRQRNRKKYYTQALNQLFKEGLIYPCSCTRADIKNAVSAPHKDENRNPTYPGTCRNNLSNNPSTALRVNISKAIKFANQKNISFLESGTSKDSSSMEKISTSNATMEQNFGDFIIARKDVGTSYNLAVVIDDAAQSVTHVTRGDDLLTITPIQVLLQKLLHLPTPIYRHHKLLYEKSGKKISKRSSPDSISSLINKGLTRNEVIDLAFNHFKNDS